MPIIPASACTRVQTHGLKGRQRAIEAGGLGVNHRRSAGRTAGQQAARGQPKTGKNLSKKCPPTPGYHRPKTILLLNYKLLYLLVFLCILATGIFASGEA